MPAGRHPLPADHHGDEVVQSQGKDRRPAARRFPKNACAVVAPSEVDPPTLTTRVEEFHATAGDGVERVRLDAFGIIAETASQPQVRFPVEPAGRSGNDVFDFQPAKHEALRTEAIAAAVAGPTADLIADLGGYASMAQGCNGPRRPRRTASRSAWAFRNRPS